MAGMQWESSSSDWVSNNGSAEKVSIHIPNVKPGDDDDAKHGELVAFIESLTNPNAQPGKEDFEKLSVAFGNVYDGGFRLDYSVVEGVIIKKCLKTGQRGAFSWDSDVLQANLSDIACHLDKEMCGAAAVDGVKKLCGHVQLENLRMTAIATQNEFLAQRIRRSEATVDSLLNQVREASGMMRDQQRDYIAILGVFSAVVLAFNGGFTLLGSVMSNVGNANPYALLFFSAFITEAIFGIFYILFSFVCRIVNGKRAAGLPWEMRPCGWKTLAGVNGACIGTMLATLALWKLRACEILWWVGLAAFVAIAIVGFVVLWRAPNGNTGLSGLVYDGEHVTIDGRTYYVSLNEGLRSKKGENVRARVIRTPIGPKLIINGKFCKIRRSDKGFMSDTRTVEDIFLARHRNGSARGPLQKG